MGLVFRLALEFTVRAFMVLFALEPFTGYAPLTANKVHVEVTAS
jgi:hypothetical protein